MESEKLILENAERNGCDLIWGIILAFAFRDSQKEISLRSAHL
jgi:hypothetical protein